MAEALSARDWSALAEFVVDETARRRAGRGDLEGQWKEIDRQIAMMPKVREVKSGQQEDWFPDLEPPLQFNALEVILADVRSLLFPRGAEWFSVSADLSDDYLERFNKRREDSPLQRGAGFSKLRDGELKSLAQQIELDQDTADVLVKAVMDHFHRLYNFRQRIDLFIAEQVKYGTGVARVRPMVEAKFAHEFRGVRDETIRGPAVIPTSIKHTYLDDTPAAAMHEGMALSPTVIRRFWRSLTDIQTAARTGGIERGWMPDQIAKLRLPSRAHDQAELLEIEGDLVVPRSRGSLFLPNVVVTVAATEKARPVRFQTGLFPFRSWVVGYYMREEVNSVYGASPLMKGQPLQEAVAEVANDMLGVAALKGRPPVLYDRNDQTLAAQGGPSLFPGAQIGTDSPNAVEIPELPDLAPLLQSLVALIKLYEDLTGVNDPRRGAPGRSHTTATQAQLETNRGIARTDDFVADLESGPITTTLYMEYEIIKKMMTRAMPVPVATGGLEGWLTVAGADLADRVSFLVHGSAGVLEKLEQDQAFQAALNFLVQAAPAAAQAGQPVRIDFLNLMVEVLNRAGIQNAAKFVAAAAGGVAGGAQGEPAVSGADQPLPDELVAALQTAGGAGPGA